MTERAVVDVGTREAPGGSFQVENPYLEQWLDKQSLELAGNVSETTTKNLQDTLSEGIRAGESVPALRSRVEDSFETASRSRANLIARTEANKGANGASWLQATSSGVVKTKTWLATGDARTRPEHQAMNGETVPIDEAFSNGLMFPSEPACRCTLTYGVDESSLARTEEPESPSYRSFTSTDEMEEWGNENFVKWRKKLKAKEAQAISDYQNGAHESLNAALRGLSSQSPSRELLDNLDSAIGKGRIPENITVLRGFDNPEISRSFGALDGIIIGDEGFVSTSLKEAVSRRFLRGADDPILAEIRIPKGAKGSYLDLVNSYDEQEILLPRDTKFRVIETSEEDGIKKMVLEVVV